MKQSPRGNENRKRYQNPHGKASCGKEGGMVLFHSQASEKGGKEKKKE